MGTEMDTQGVPSACDNTGSCPDPQTRKTCWSEALQTGRTQGAKGHGANCFCVSPRALTQRRRPCAARPNKSCDGGPAWEGAGVGGLRQR